MIPRRTIAKLACLILIGPVFIYGIVKFRYLLDDEHEVRQSRMSLWKKTGYGVQSSSSADEISPSLNWKRKSASRPVGDKTKENAEEKNITKLRKEVIMALKKLDIAKKELHHREVVSKYPNTDGKLGWKKENSSENKAGIVNKLHERIEHSDWQRDEMGIDKILETEGEIGNYFDEDEDDEDIEDDPNLNADVVRAVPVSHVKRYVDEPVDPHEYNYIYNPSHRCYDKDGRPRSVFLLLMVVTAPGHFPRRDVIRNTYGSEDQWPALKRGVFTTVFLLGKTFNDTQQKMIDKEAQTYGDIVQEDFIDTYANLSRKTVMGLKWVTNHCRHTTFVMKIDDDSMINQGRFLWIFKDSSLTNWTAAETMLNAPVLRSTTSKYFISEEYYPAPTYPPYMNGPGYVMSSDLVESGYHMALKTPLFPWEDVFLGTCFKKMGFKPVYHKRFLWIPNPEFFTLNSERTIVAGIRPYIVISNLQPNTMKFIWFICKIKLIRPV